MDGIDIIDVNLKSCSLNLGELHRLTDYGYFSPAFQCVTKEGQEFVAKMRLHITESLDPIVFLDPRSFDDSGMAVNSVNSPVLRRKRSYAEESQKGDSVFLEEIPPDAKVYGVSADQIRRAVLAGYSFPDPDVSSTKDSEIAFTCHDPSIIGGGNLILFRYVNWLAELGIKVRVYTCGSLPFWTRVSAEFRLFSSYEEMFATIEEKTVVLFAMWHIEPMLKTRPFGKRIFMFHQGIVSFHYGQDESSMLALKPVIDLLESLPLGVIAISPYLSEKYRASNRKENHFIPNGVDLPVLHSPDKTPDDGIIKIVTVGSPGYCLKGTPVVAQALVTLSRENSTTKFMWTVCSGDDEVYVPDEIRGIHNIGYVHRLKLTRQEITEVYRSADVFVNASLNEGFGLPSLEAMSCGIPVVQADNGGLSGIVENGRDCLVVPINDANAIAEAITRIVTDPGLSAHLVENGYETVTKHNVLNQFNHFYRAFENICGVKFDGDGLERIKDRLNGRFSVSANREAKKSDKDARPLVSIIIPTYNQANYLKETLDSIIAQTYTNWEAIVVNDGSRDHTIEVMEDYGKKDKRIRTFSKENGGISSALNRGIEMAVGDYFCWLSSDDLFYDYKLELQINKFRELDDSYALIYGGYDLLIQERNEIVITNPIEPIESGAEFPEMLKHDFIYGCSVMIRMDIIRDIGAFHPKFRHAQDTEFWLRIASRGYRFYLMNEKLAIRREHIEQASTGNIIYCRYDAVCMIDYYLRRYHLFEMYRYFNMNDDVDIDRFIKHLAGRFYGEDPTVNYPLLRERFWEWFDEGLTALSPERQRYILKGVQDISSEMIIWYPYLKFYIDKCKMSLARERVQKPVFIDYTVSDDRDIMLNNRDKDESNRELFVYAAHLLENSNTQLFAQTLEAHNTNKQVDNRFKLAHSVIRYMGQYENDYQSSCLPFKDMSCIPEDQERATELFYRIYFPAEYEQLVTLTDGGLLMSRKREMISRISNEGKLLIRDICRNSPTEKTLHWWNAILYESEGNFSRAVLEGLKVKVKNSTDRALVRQQVLRWMMRLRFHEIIVVMAEALHEKMQRMKRIMYYPFYLIKAWLIFLIKTINKLLSVIFRSYLNKCKAGEYVYAHLKNVRNKLFKIKYS